MKNNFHRRSCALGLLLLLILTDTAQAQEVVIPDAGLKRAIWNTLKKPLPVGALTEDDMLKLTELYADTFRVRSLEGLGAARNLTTLSLYNPSSTVNRYRIPEMCGFIGKFAQENF